MLEVLIDERHLTSPEEVHALLQRDLGFPEHYGGNFSALNDCLGDVDEQVRIIVRRGGGSDELDGWFDKLCVVLGRNALENPNLDVVIRRG